MVKQGDGIKFEIRKDGKVYSSTTDEKLIYPRETLKSMVKAGYIPYLNGKRV
jgi:hypothetical protein